MGEAGALRLTTALYYTPSGKSIQGTGITPDITVEQPLPPELQGGSRLPGKRAFPVTFRAKARRMPVPVPPPTCLRKPGTTFSFNMLCNCCGARRRTHPSRRIRKGRSPSTSPSACRRASPAPLCRCANAGSPVCGRTPSPCRAASIRRAAVYRTRTAACRRARGSGSRGGDGGRFHVESDGTRLGEALDRPALVAQFPVAVVDGGDGAGAHDALEVVAFEAGDFLHRAFQRHLHFGKRRDRHPDRQVVVENVVLAHIGMRQHIVAECLAVSKARAVAEHQPGVRAQDGDMVGDRLGVGRADADIDERDAAVPLLLDVIGRHLRQAADGDVRLGPVGAGHRRDVAGLHEGRIAVAAPRHLLARPFAEFVDIELVVREEHEVLEVLGVGRRIVAETGERIVDALRGEGGERRGFAGAGLVGAVGDLVVRGRQVRRIEEIAQRKLDAFRDFRLHMGAFAEGEMQGDRRRRFRDDDAYAMVAHQEAELFLEVVPEEFGPGDGRRVDAGRGDVTVGKAGIDMAEAGRLDADLRIAGTEPTVRRPGFAEAHESVGQERRIAVVELLQCIDRGHRIVEGSGLVGVRLRCFLQANDNLRGSASPIAGPRERSRHRRVRAPRRRDRSGRGACPRPATAREGGGDIDAAIGCIGAARKRAVDLGEQPAEEGEGGHAGQKPEDGLVEPPPGPEGKAAGDFGEGSGGKDEKGFHPVLRADGVMPARFNTDGGS
ncbi:carboxy-terminal-processing protease [Ditylenchus destructor]|uniref:Carboxy-terminal-processing protease n=1 Tax=Ditylenchus destructor TaxID=166010 RepID=A0AAD4QRC5_9BILA|nr:carboxy-terminal-processing protease [Ditylenchus destructor]